MIDQVVTVTIEPAGDVVLLDHWSGDIAVLCGDIARLQIEPRRWWLLGAGDWIDALARQFADHGALAPIGGGLIRATLTGPGWRSVLMVAGLFDAEDAAFTTGALASTMIHHIAVRITVTGEQSCEIYFAASYAPALIEHWTKTVGPHAVVVDAALAV